MKSSTAKTVVSIFSIILGFIGFIGTLAEGYDALGILITLALFTSGILLLIPSLRNAEKGLVIGCLSYYSFVMLLGLILFTVFPGLGLIIIALFGVPFSFSIVFLVSKSREVRKSALNKEVIEPTLHEEVKNNDLSTMKSKLNDLKSLVDEGLITEDDYEKKKKALLEIE